jgi:hypothetical protein
MGNPRGRPFEPGNNFGQGRPKGSRNKKFVRSTVLEQYFDHLQRKVVALALNGDKMAMRLWFDWMKTKNTAPRLNLPSLKTMKDVSLASEKLVKAMGRGDLTALETDRAMSVLESRSRIIDDTDQEARIQAVERARTQHGGDSWFEIEPKSVIENTHGESDAQPESPRAEETL